MSELVIKLSNGKEVKIDRDALEAINKYVRFEVSLEALAKELGLESWEETYELIKKIPAWIAWTPPSVFNYEKERLINKLKSQ
ncbi:MAG: hypothetical protein RMH77_04480 [Sulfolobales archaeon]|nr:hypothetical protein [Sulfolobales archaeon]MCX8185699.1 hypothetical protein [Sulfolobales archaeon]MDW7969642.1 hypothetical protein [Sulfolobales archaeon]